MKKTLLSAIAAFAVLFTQAQLCVPDPQYTSSGIYPDSATNLPDALLNTPYNTVVTVVVPADTVIEIIPGFPQTVTIDSINITDIQNLPPGFTYACEPPTCALPGGQSSCIIIQGTATNPGDVGTVYNLRVYVDSYSSDLMSIPVSDSILYYHIRIWYAAGTNPETGKGFWVGQNSPNPATGITSFDFSSSGAASYHFELFNALGQRVMDQTFSTDKLMDRFTIDTRAFDNGVYFYRVSSNGYSTTHRLSIAKY